MFSEYACGNAEKTTKANGSWEPEANNFCCGWVGIHQAEWRKGVGYYVGSLSEALVAVGVGFVFVMAPKGG